MAFKKMWLAFGELKRRYKLAVTSL
jgi:hypothetical protein